MIRANSDIIDSKTIKANADIIDSKTIKANADNIDSKTFHKMLFIYNSVEKGWNVKKRDDKYIFQKSHDGKREVFMEDYLEKFISENSSMQ
jgi:hypothetical protein